MLFARSPPCFPGYEGSTAWRQDFAQMSKMSDAAGSVPACHSSVACRANRHGHIPFAGCLLVLLRGTQFHLDNIHKFRA